MQVVSRSFSLYEGLRPWDSDQNDMIEQAMKMGSVLLEAGKMGSVLLVPEPVRWDEALLFCIIRWMKRLRAETNLLPLLGTYGHQVFDVIPQRNWY
ncbi:hypothetical protein RHGRI_024076 [Rhododendron griersonianum]|uniref:Uncharacterized protein n=1 Tax=Rhododendron griersonianum TaxID=479676 RepID=A0AAV6J5W4_9ERIC|nr:hypothetical protein RHGRI_024076 [Rhododendron griersonianum]